MTAIKVAKSVFTGLSRIHEKNGGLADMVRGLAIDHARIKIASTGVADLTDNSAGTAGVPAAMTIPTAAYDATVSGGALRTDFNTAMDKLENASKVLVNSMNNLRARLGLPLLTAASGIQAAADTIPAQDLSVTTTSGVTALDYAGGRAAMEIARSNMRALVKSMNEITTAIGEDTLDDANDGEFTLNTLGAIADAAASTTGASAVSKAVVDAFLTASANNIATLAVQWNAYMAQTGLTDLTDSSTGVAAATLVVNPAPAAAVGAATTSSPKAGFDTQLVAIENNLSDLTLRTNLLLRRQGLAVLADSTGASPNTTLEALSAALAAVDGSAGTVAVDETTARLRMATINNALASICAKVNTLAALFGVPALTDNSGGTTSSTIANIAATGTGVGGATPVTMLDSAVDTWLDVNKNNIASLAAKLNAMTGTEVSDKGLSVVAV